jgi:hypothetical protein
VAKIARGYVYYVSLKGVTGASHLDTADVAKKLAEVRRHVVLPIGVGFGHPRCGERACDRQRRRRRRHRQPHHQEIESGPRKEPRSAPAWLADSQRARSMRERAA